MAMTASATMHAVLLVLAVLTGFALCMNTAGMLGSELLVGGPEVDLSKAKTLVQIEHKDKHGKWAFKCTGFIGKTNLILTTASCVGDSTTKKPLATGSLRVRAGSTKSLHGGQVLAVRRVQLHPKWRFSVPKHHADVVEYSFDVAVVTLQAPINLSANIKAATLPAIGKPPAAETMVLAAGFALASATDATKLTLRRNVVRVIPNSNCRVLIEHLGGSVTRDQFCVRNGIGKAFCTTDSGAPATRSTDGAVVGIFSWSWSTCGFDSVPGVLTDLTNAEVRQFVDKALA